MEIIEKLIPQTAGEIIGTIMLPIIIITIGVSIYRTVKMRKQIKLVDEIFGKENLTTKLGRNTIKYPIIGFEGDLAEPIQINSREEMKTDHPGGIGVKYIITAEYQKVFIKNIAMQEIGGTDPRIATMKFKGIGPSSKEITDFLALKSQILKGIKKINNSVYAGLEKEIENTQNTEELVKVMNKGAY